MRPTRRNLVLAALALGLLALELGSGGERARGPEVALPGFRPARVEAVRVARGAAAVDLVRADGRWVVRQRASFPAYEETITTLVTRLAALSSADVVATTRASHGLFGFDQEPARVTLSDGAGELVLALEMARPADEPNGSYVRVDGRDVVWRAAAIPLPTPDPVRWLDTRLAELEIPSVRVVRVARGDERHELVLEDDGRWRVSGGDRRLTQSQVQPLLLVVGTTYFEDLALDLEPAAAGLAPPRVALTFELEGGGLRHVHVGDDVAGRRAFTRPEWSRSWVVLVREQTARNLDGALARLLGAL